MVLRQIILAALILFAWQVKAQSLAGDRDQLELRASTEGHAAELFYRNSALQSSGPVNGLRFEFEGVTVFVWVEIGGAEVNFAEILRVEAEGFVPFPAEIAVPDGAETVVQIMRPMF